MENFLFVVALLGLSLLGIALACYMFGIGALIGGNVAVFCRFILVATVAMCLMMATCVVFKFCEKKKRR